AKAAAPALLDALQSDDDQFRSVAAASLVRIVPDDPALVKGLIDASRDANYPKAQIAAVDALNFLGPRAKAALPLLVETARSAAAPDDLRGRAVVALSSMEHEAKPAVPALAALLKDPKQPP